MTSSYDFLGRCIIKFYGIEESLEQRSTIPFTQEDAALMQIIQVQKIRKWSAVSRTMEAEFKIVGRTGKQCRERWHNQLDPSIKRS